MEIIKKSIKELNEQERFQQKRIQLVIDASEKTEKLADDAVEEKYTEKPSEGKLKL